jgi:hypothetical protein
MPGDDEGGHATIGQFVAEVQSMTGTPAIVRRKASGEHYDANH